VAQQVVMAVLDLGRERIAVAGGAALEHVRNEDLLALHPDFVEQLVEQLARPAHERKPLLVLAGPGRLADEHQLRVGVAVSEHDRLAGCRELAAALAGTRLREHLLERLAPLRSQSYALRNGHVPIVLACSEATASRGTGPDRNVRNDHGMDFTDN